MKIKFNHKKKCILKAMGSDLTTKEVSKLVNKVMEKFMTDDSIGKGSHLAELVQDNLPNEAILFIAVQGLKDRMKPALKGGIFDAIRRGSDKETEPSLEGFHKFVENLIQGLEKAEVEAKKEDTKPEKDATDKGTKD